MIIGTIKILRAPDRRADVLEILRSVQGPVRAQPGCAACDVFEEQGPESAIVFIERWDSDATLEAHLRSETYRRILAAIELSSLPPDVRFEHLPEPTAENLEKAGAKKEVAQQLANAKVENTAQAARLNDDRLLAGFGNNGGEEFYSFLMTRESLVITGGENWTKWNSKMHEKLNKVQNGDGSWSGHHCITSPVFCTAAVVACLTTDRDGPILVKVAQAAGKEAEKVETAKR